ncbi:hypothetical protein HPP92_010958 [Vanilla planifolia]|uniref:Uncharacterized protein n=1 Tax=Vanilla planifolia TaxID=51239 RepID=A0A835V1C1_VANPL|nr:hypothetical protein HPP92_010958 [Vanilla planifolia]
MQQASGVDQQLHQPWIPPAAMPYPGSTMLMQHPMVPPPPPQFLPPHFFNPTSRCTAAISCTSTAVSSPNDGTAETGNNAEVALQALNGTIIGKQTAELSWGRNPATTKQSYHHINNECSIENNEIKERISLKLHLIQEGVYNVLNSNINNENFDLDKKLFSV